MEIRSVFFAGFACAHEKNVLKCHSVHVERESFAFYKRPQSQSHLETGSKEGITN